VVTVGVLALVGGVAYEWQQERVAAAKAPKKATAVAKAAPREIPRTAPIVPVQQAAAPAPAAPAAEKAKAPVVAPEKTKTVAAVPVVVTAEKPKVVSGPHRLVVRTDGEAWIEIKDSSDRMLVSSLNPAGSERVVRGRPPYQLVIGNASNVRITYDDKLIDLAPHTRQDVARLTVP